MKRRDFLTGSTAAGLALAATATSVAERSATLSEASRVVESKVGAPLSSRFVRHDDIALGQQVFDVTKLSVNLW